MLVVLNQSGPIPGVSSASGQICEKNPDPSLRNNFRARMGKIITSLSVESAWLGKRIGCGFKDACCKRYHQFLFKRFVEKREKTREDNHDFYSGLRALNDWNATKNRYLSLRI